MTSVLEQNINKSLFTIQQSLNAPKGNVNSFGGYKYRSAEDILAALKEPLLTVQCSITLSDDLVVIGSRYYIRATATLCDCNGNQISAVGFAREEEFKTGMAGSQITGATSSYARKYALSGLFAIDDERDADATNEHTEKKYSSYDFESAYREPSSPENEPVCSECAGPLSQKTLVWARENNIPDGRLRCYECNKNRTK